MTFESRLDKGMKFGLYEGGKICYFDDGTSVGQTELWQMVRNQKHLDTTDSNITLTELYPDTYIGVFKHKFSTYRISRKFFGYIFGVI